MCTWLCRGRYWQPLQYFNMFSNVGTEMVEYQKQLGVLWWDRPDTLLLVLTLAFKTFFFVMTSVILMNMLIAMMTVRRRPFPRLTWARQI